MRNTKQDDKLERRFVGSDRKATSRFKRNRKKELISWDCRHVFTLQYGREQRVCPSVCLPWSSMNDWSFVTRFLKRFTYQIEEQTGLHQGISYLTSIYNSPHQVTRLCRELPILKCTKKIKHQQMHKEFFSSIITHSYMFRPCWVILREKLAVVVTLGCTIQLSENVHSQQHILAQLYSAT
jgi:hypothetical protein